MYARLIQVTLKPEQVDTVAVLYLQAIDHYKEAGLYARYMFVIDRDAGKDCRSWQVSQTRKTLRYLHLSRDVTYDGLFRLGKVDLIPMERIGGTRPLLAYLRRP